MDPPKMRCETSLGSSLLTAAVAATLLAGGAVGAWSQFRGDPGHRALADDPALVTAPRNPWTHEADGHILASPAVAEIGGQLRIVAASYPTDGVGSVFALRPDGTEVWSTTPSPTTSGGFLASPGVGDTDGDGAQEVVVPKMEDSTLYLLDGSDGTQEASMAIGLANQDIWTSSPTVADLDDDGTVEIAVGGSRSGTPGSFLIVSGDLGGVLFEHTLNAPAGSNPLVADLDGDGEDEIAVATGVPDNACLIFGTLHPTNNPETGDDEGRLYVFDRQGGAWQEAWNRTLEGPTLAAPAAGDLDGDGTTEVVVGSQGPRGSCTDATQLQQDGHLHVFAGPDGTTETIESSFSFVPSSSSPLVHDIDGDGQQEIVQGVWNGIRSYEKVGGDLVLDAEATIPSPDGPDHWVLASPALTDLDGDAQVDLVAQSMPVKVDESDITDSEVKPGYVFGVDGGTFDIRWKWQTPRDGGLSGPVPADVDGDGLAEILAGTGFPRLGETRELHLLGPANPIVTGIDHDPDEPTSLDDVTFSATVRDEDSPSQDLSYRWRFGHDDASATGPTPTHSFPDDGDYTVTLNVTDGDGHSWEADRIVSVLNVAPDAAFDHDPLEPDPGETVRFTSTSSDPDGSLVSETWTFPDGSTADGSEIDRSFAEPGDKQVCLDVTDDDGGKDRACRVVHVNAPPTADFTHDPSEPLTGEVVDLEDASSDADGTIDTRRWTFGDGDTATGASPTHAWADDGTYEITLNVTDDDGATDETVHEIRVRNRPPDADAGPDRTLSDHDGSGAETVILDGTGSSDADGFVADHAWFEDGLQIASGPTPELTLDVGTHRIRLLATDDDGATDDDTVEITVEANRPPEADLAFSPDAPLPGETVDFTDRSDDPDGDLTGWTWSFGDGNSSTSRHPSHSYADAGTYDITLEVTDDGGAGAVAQATIEVGPKAPTADAGSDRTLSDHDASGTETVTLDARGSSDPNDDIISFNWSADGTRVATGPTPTVELEEGDHTLELTVRDGTNLTDRDRVNVTVEPNRPPEPQIAFDPEAPRPGETVRFADRSRDDGRIVDRRWRFGDGATATGTDPGHIYDEPGDYTVELTVTDDGGATATARREIEVIDPAPDLRPIPNRQVAADGRIAFRVEAPDPEGQPVELSASGLPGGAVFEDLGDATGIFDWTPSPDRIGDHDVTFAATDGTTRVTTTAQISVEDPDGTPSVEILPPLAVDRSPRQLTVGQEVRLRIDAGSADISDLRLLPDGEGSQELDLEPSGDGTWTAGPVAYDETGPAIVQAAVGTDGGEVTTSDVLRVTVDRPPVARLAREVVTVDEVEPDVRLDGSPSEDPDGRPLTYLWELPGGDLRTSSGPVWRVPPVSWTPERAGVHLANLTVRDAGFATDRTSAEIRVDDAIGVDARPAPGSARIGPDEQPIVVAEVVDVGGRPEAGATVWFNVTHALTDEVAASVQATTGTDGRTEVTLPYDVTLASGTGANLVGEHHVTVETRVPNALDLEPDPAAWETDTTAFSYVVAATG